MKKLGIIFRATAVVSMVSALVVGATFALTNEAFLLNNTFSTNSNNGDLLISKNQGGPFHQSIQGFDFGDIEEDCTPNKTIFLKNDDADDMDVTIAAELDEDIEDDVAENVIVRIKNPQESDTATYSLAELEDENDLGMPGISEHSESNGGVLDEGEVERFRFCLELEDELDEGEELDESEFDLIFTGEELNGDDDDEDDLEEV